MALTQPELLKTTAFDATKDRLFLFRVPAGDLVVANKLVITLNDGSGTVAYEATQTRNSLDHLLPANTLDNGEYYTAYLVTYDSVGNESPASNIIEFRCFDEGVISLSNVPLIVNTASFKFEAAYDRNPDAGHADDIIDYLESYNFIFYDKGGVQIDDSGVQHIGIESIPTTVSYTFNGFTSGAKYGVRVVGTTQYGMTVDSHIVEFDVEYEAPTAVSLLNVSNVCDEGYIRVAVKVFVADGKTIPEHPIYIADKEIDLTASGSQVEWNEGWSLTGDFSLNIWGRKFNNGGKIAFMQDSDASYRMELYYHDDSELQKVYVDCYIYSGTDIPMYIYSNYIDRPSDNDYIYIWFTKVGNLFDIKILNKGGEA